MRTTRCRSTARFPRPTTGYLHVEIIRISFHSLAKLDLLHEPEMARMKVGFVHRPVGMGGQLFWIVLQCAPEIGYPAIEVVYGFDLRVCRAAKEHSQTARRTVRCSCEHLRSSPIRCEKRGIFHRTTPYGNGARKRTVPLPPPLDMRPNLPVDDSENVSDCDPRAARYRSKRLTTSARRSNGGDFLWGQFGIVVVFSARVGSPILHGFASPVVAPLLHHVVVIDGFCSKKKVSWIYAGRIVSAGAIMKNTESFRNCSVMNFPREPMRPVLDHNAVLRIRESAVSLIACRCGP